MGSIVAEIDAWITAISSNASLIANGAVPVKVREPSDSTNSGVTNGFGYQFPDTSVSGFGPTDVTLIVYGPETDLNMEVGDEFIDTTANDGFGDMGSTFGEREFEDFAGNAAFDREAIVIYDDTDGQEFLVVGFKLGTGTSDSGGFCVFKDQDNHWCILMRLQGFAYDNVLGFWTGNPSLGNYGTSPSALTNTSYSFPPLIVRATDFFDTLNVPGYDQRAQGYWRPANAALYSGRGSTSKLGNYLILSSSNEVMVESGASSVAVKLPYVAGGP